MARKIVLLSAFALPGERWISSESLHLLDELSPDELQPYIDGGCIRVDESVESEQIELLESEISLHELPEEIE